MFVEREVRDEPFQPAVCVLQLPEAAQLTNTQVGVFSLPGIEGGGTDAELPTEITDGSAGFGLPDRVHDLFLRELRPLHRSTPFFQDR